MADYVTGQRGTTSLEEVFAKGLAAYRSERYFEAHEHFEELWRQERDPGRKYALQGLVLVAVAMHKVRVQHKRRVGARLLRRADDRFSRGPCRVEGIAVDELRRALESRWRALEGGEAISAPALRVERPRDDR